MTTIKEYSGVVALVILAIMGLSGFVKGNSFGSASACTDGYTCYTNLEVQGNQIVDGTVSFVGTVMQTGKALFTGGIYASSTIQTSGPLVNYTTNSATSTTSLGCIQATATSTATPIKLTFSQGSLTATSTFSGTVTGGFVIWAFGSCP